MQMRRLRQKKEKNEKVTDSKENKVKDAACSNGKSRKVKKFNQINQSENAFHVVRYETVDESSDGQRLDNFLITKLKGVPKSHLYRIIRSGEIRVNKGRAKADDRINLGDVIRIPPIKCAEKATDKVPVFSLSAAPRVIFEDEHLLIVDKPSGMASHGGSGISYGLIERMRASRPELVFLELVHRLDKGTSGVMILAKSRKSLVRLHDQIRNSEVKKTYTALVKGDWVNDRQHLRFPLRKYVTASGERRVVVDEENGLPAHSIFRLIERFGQVSLLEVDLLTGRTHQIRVHAQAAGHPLVGDEKYGDFAFNEEVAKGLLGYPLKRMFLHSTSIVFRHPITGEDLKVEAPLPTECKLLIQSLETSRKNK